MGWGGAGLGANEQGIAEPIKGGEVLINKFFSTEKELDDITPYYLGSR